MNLSAVPYVNLLSSYVNLFRPYVNFLKLSFPKDGGLVVDNKLGNIY